MVRTGSGSCPMASSGVSSVKMVGLHWLRFSVSFL
jgi:hypothetical protein